MTKKLEIIGSIFGRLTVVSEAARPTSGVIQWLCVCECGNETVVSSGKLTSGNTRSCGCLRRDVLAARAVNDKRDEAECRTWMSMKARCFDNSREDYPRYGGRGISVCAKWVDSFDAFLSDMGRRPTPSHQIDRINNDGDYEPSNCRWVTAAQNSQNRRSSKTWIVHGVRYATRQHAAEALGVSKLTIFSRVKRNEDGYSVESRYQPA